MSPDDDSLEAWEHDWDDDDPDGLDDPDDPDAIEEVGVDVDGRPLSGPGSLAVVWQRAVARLVDVFVVFNVAGLLTVVVARPSDDDSSIFSYVVVQTVFLVIAAIYEAGMVAWRGQTLGKMLLRLRVVRRSDGSAPTPAEAVVRFFPWLWLYVPFVGQFLWIVMYLTAIPNDRRQGWHDRAASTLVLSSR